MKKKKKLKSKTKLKQEADKWFSLFIRKRDNGRCFTCDVQKDISEMQNGHYQSRRHLNTRYCEKNSNCQCVSCNIFLRGNLQLYAIRLQKKYGQGILKELFRKSHTLIKSDRKFYEDIIKKYK